MEGEEGARQSSTAIDTGSERGGGPVLELGAWRRVVVGRTPLRGRKGGGGSCATMGSCLQGERSQLLRSATVGLEEGRGWQGKACVGRPLASRRQNRLPSQPQPPLVVPPSTPTPLWIYSHRQSMSRHNNLPQICVRCGFGGSRL